MTNADWTATPDGSQLTIHIPQGVTQLNLISPAPPPGGNPTLSFRTLLSHTTGGGGQAGSDTYAAADIGTPAANRTVFAVVGYRRVGTGSVASVTIGGVAAQMIPFVASSDQFGATYIEIWAAAVPNGATGDVVIVYTAALDRATCVALYAAYGLSSMTPTAWQGSNSQTAPSLSLTTHAGGIIIAGTWTFNASAMPFVTWNGSSASDGEIFTDPTGQPNELQAVFSQVNVAAGTTPLTAAFQTPSTFASVTIAAAYR